MPTSGPIVELKQRAARARAWLVDDALPLWWERGFDRQAGCFHEQLGLDGDPVPSPRRIRVQARQTVVYARASRLGWNGPWREAVEAGANILSKRAVRADGGVRHLLSATGGPLDERRDLYDLAFVVFGLAEAARALGGRDDLVRAATSLLDWADAHWAHPAGGFREGEVALTPPRRQNPHMHMFEAALALHEATGAGLERASALARLFETRLFDARFGALPEYFDEEWRPMPGEQGRICEPGHQFEWSWLLDRWRVVGGGDLSALADRLRGHGERYGVDAATGAVYDGVWTDGRVRTPSSRLWPHTERLKANLVRFERTRDSAAAEAALQAFDMLMRYCDTPVRGLWRDKVLADGSFADGPAPASSFYHVIVAFDELMRVADALD